mmetsp:Transcript_15387/g.27497  ORF Transcript_15387/g.27497 Transcript_15387/m.27497 type:complete len:408 (+) Transcript_15387:212-1435(+)
MIGVPAISGGVGSLRGSGRTSDILAAEAGSHTSEPVFRFSLGTALLFPAALLPPVTAGLPAGAAAAPAEKSGAAGTAPSITGGEPTALLPLPSVVKTCSRGDCKASCFKKSKTEKSKRNTCTEGFSCGSGFACTYGDFSGDDFVDGAFAAPDFALPFNCTPCAAAGTDAGAAADAGAGAVPARPAFGFGLGAGWKVPESLALPSGSSQGAVAAVAGPSSGSSQGAMVDGLREPGREPGGVAWLCLWRPSSSSSQSAAADGLRDPGREPGAVVWLGLRRPAREPSSGSSQGAVSEGLLELSREPDLESACGSSSGSSQGALSDCRGEGPVEPGAAGRLGRRWPWTPPLGALPAAGALPALPAFSSAEEESTSHGATGLERSVVPVLSALLGAPAWLDRTVLAVVLVPS